MRDSFFCWLILLEMNVIWGGLVVTRACHPWSSRPLMQRVHTHTLLDGMVTLPHEYLYVWTTILCLLGHFLVLYSPIPEYSANEKANETLTPGSGVLPLLGTPTWLACLFDTQHGVGNENVPVPQDFQGLFASDHVLDLVCHTCITEINQFSHLQGVTQKILRNLTL